MEKFDYNWQKKERFIEFSREEFKLLNEELQKELLEFDYHSSHEEGIDSPITKYTILLPITSIVKFKSFISKKSKSK